MAEFFGLNKWKFFFKTIKAHGGIFKTLYKLWRFDTFRYGCLMGWDVNGNKYYENNRYPIGRARWVEYADHYKWDYEGSQVSPEWFGWLHYMTDRLPCDDPVKASIRRSNLQQRWLMPAEENLSGTARAFYPYSTIRQYVHVWGGDAESKLPCSTDQSSCTK